MELKAFLLTDEYFTLGGKDHVRFYANSENGGVELLFQHQPTYFFLPRTVPLEGLQISHKREEVPYQSFDGTPVDKAIFNNFDDATRVSETLRGSGCPIYEDDLRPPSRFLMDHFLNGALVVKGEAKPAAGLLRFINPELSPSSHFPLLKVLSIDIETDLRNDRLYSIAVHCYQGDWEKSLVLMIGNGPCNRQKGIFYFPTEKAMLVNWVRLMIEWDPDILIGWFVVGFDLRVLSERCDKWGVEFNIGRGKRLPRFREKARGNTFLHIPGRIVMDGPPTIRSSFLEFEDYKLQTVAMEVLREGKSIDFGENSKQREITDLFERDPEKLAEYNLKDAVLVSQIFQKLGLVELMVERSKLSGMLPDRVHLTGQAFDHYLLPRVHQHNLVAPSIKDIVKPRRNKGAYIIEPTPGLYDNVIGLDFRSLYPSLIATFNIDPISFNKPGENPLVLPNGIHFSRTEHELPELIDTLLLKREQAKKDHNGPLSKAVKTLMNTFYGIMGSDGCRFFHRDLVQSVSLTGNWILTESQKYLEENGYRVLYGDTDSLFLALKPGQDSDQAKEICESLNSYWTERVRSEYGLRSRMEIKFDKFFSRFLLPMSRSGGGAKKKYAGLLGDLTSQEVHFVGMESVRSDWTPLAKRFQLELMLKIFHRQAYVEWIVGFIKDLREAKFDDELFYHKRLRKPLSEYKNLPPQVRAAKMLGGSRRSVDYIITKEGPVPKGRSPENPDYDHYINKQLRPIADCVLKLLGTNLKEALQGKSSQLSLF